MLLSGDHHAHVGIEADIELELKAVRSKEMCRLAQRRFRAKQKQTLTGLEAELAEKRGELTAAAAEHGVLNARYRVLEAAVAARDEQLGVLRKAQEAVESPAAFFPATLTDPGRADVVR